MSWKSLLRNGRVVNSTDKAKTEIKGTHGTALTAQATVNGQSYPVYNHVNVTGSYAENKSSEWQITGTIGGTADAYLLPFRNSEIHCMTLGNAASLFLTYKLNGCGVMISGANRQSPTVIHANANQDPRTDDLSNIGTAYRDAYQDMQGVLSTPLHGYIDPGTYTIWQPIDYQGFGGVFGVRSTQGWTFYGHLWGTKGGETKPIWPDSVVPDPTRSSCLPCFITTAVCRHLGLPDDCEELETFRKFRSEVLLTSRKGTAEVDFYYELGPRIVEAIDARADAGRIYERIYAASIRPAVEAIRQGHPHEAYDQLRKMVFDNYELYTGRDVPLNDLEAKYRDRGLTSEARRVPESGGSARA